MHTVVVVHQASRKVAAVYGTYRSTAKAQEVADLCRNTQAVDYYGEDAYDVHILPVRRYGE